MGREHGRVLPNAMLQGRVKEELHFGRVWGRRKEGELLPWEK